MELTKKELKVLKRIHYDIECGITRAALSALKDARTEQGKSEELKVLSKLIAELDKENETTKI